MVAAPNLGLVRDEARRRRRPRLVVANEAIRDLVFVESSEFVIGRKSTAEQSVEHMLAHDGVSSAHARISYDGQDFWIEDLGSKNHTYVGGKRLEAHVKTLLPNETAVRFAVVDALFVVDPEPEADVVARRIYETTLARLRARSVITQTQEARARQEAGGDIRRAGEKLLLGGVLSVAQWGDAYRKAENLVARESLGGGKLGERGSSAPKLSLVHVLVGLIVLVLLAIITLVTVQWVK
jgi:pSer/pThr/pTyr-binding forkhead associated (FHA) protein